MNNRHRISMRLDIYLFEFYLIYTFTKQCKEEVDGNLSICLDDPKTSVAKSRSYQITTLITSLKVWNVYWRGVLDPQIWRSKPLQEPRYKQPRKHGCFTAFFPQWQWLQEIKQKTHAAVPQQQCAVLLGKNQNLAC